MSPDLSRARRRPPSGCSPQPPSRVRRWFSVQVEEAPGELDIPGEPSGSYSPLHSATRNRRLCLLSRRSQFTRIGYVPGGGRPFWREGGTISYEARPSRRFQPNGARLNSRLVVNRARLNPRMVARRRRRQLHLHAFSFERSEFRVRGSGERVKDFECEV